MDSDQPISNNAKKAIVICQTVVYVLFITPFMIYNMKQLSRISASLLYKKRHPRILRLQGIFIIAWFAFIAPLMALAFSELTDFSVTTQEIIARFNCTLYPFVSFGFTSTNAWRFWLIFFDLKYNNAQKNSEWKYYLYPTDADRAFWLLHRADYGSYFGTKKIFAGIYCGMVFVMITAYQMVIGTPYLLVGHVVSVLCHTLSITVILLVWWRLPSYCDDLYVKKEAKLVSIILVCSSGASNTAIVICLILGYNMLMSLTTISGSIVIFNVALVSFWWVPKKVVLIELEQQILRTSTRMQSGSIDSLVRDFKSGVTNKERNKETFNQTLRRLSQNTNRKGKKKHNFYTIASNPSTFKMLMQHLGHEFSMESLLSFVEIVQYKFVLKLRSDRIDPGLIKKQHAFDRNVPLSNACPISYINKHGFSALSAYKKKDDPNNTIIPQAKRVSFQLYNKYIKVGSELEINIGSDDRLSLCGLMEDESQFMESESLEVNDLFTIFDSAAAEVLRLLRRAFFRFQHKPEWKLACKILDDEP